MTEKVKAYRKGLVASIHIAKNDLGLDDEIYRELLFNVTGEVTSAKCGVKQLQAMLAELRKKGWKPKPKMEDTLASLRGKILAQCHSLEVPVSYAEAIIHRQTKGGATLKSATRAQLTACISALTTQQTRMANGE